MSEDLAVAAMYAMQALVGAMRHGNMLTDDFIKALDQQTDIHINYASVIESSAATEPDPAEARAIRHGIWWLRQCVLPEANYLPSPVTEHPRHSHEWPSLEERWQDGE